MPLTHDDVLLLHAYLDGELDLATSLNMERRIREDPVLQRVAREVKGLKLALSRMHTDREVADAFLSRLERKLGIGRRWSPPQWMLLAASLMIVAGISGSLTSIAVLQRERRAGKVVRGHPLQHHRGSLRERHGVGNADDLCRRHLRILGV